MRLTPEHVSETALAILASRAVPLPGGHGVWFSDIRDRYPQLVCEPTVQARCYICLTLLGDGDGEQRWNPKEWWPHAMVWFDKYCAELASRLNGPRWAYLLAGMLKVAGAWLESDPQLRHLKTFATDCHGRAEDRLRQITRYGQGKIGLSALPDLPIGMLIGPMDQRWQEITEVLLGPNAGHVELLHFMHIFHSNLGIAQHSMDERYASRVAFYSQLLAILEQGIGLAEVNLESASRVASALKRTALLSDSAEPVQPNARLMSQLPESFQLATYISQPPPRSFFEMRLAHAPTARDRLLATYDLASAVADLIMDIFRSGGVDGPAFRPSAYDYLHSLVRYGPKMYVDQAQKGLLPERAADTREKPKLSCAPMTRSFAERMRSGILVEPARQRIKEDIGSRDNINHLESRQLGAVSNDRGSL